MDKWIIQRNSINFIVRFVIAVVIILWLVFYYRYAQNRDENIRQLQEIFAIRNVN